MSYVFETLRRMGRSWGWVAAQFWALSLMALAAIGWIRVPEKHAWQVALTLLVPAMLLAAFLVFEAGTMRSLSDEKERRTPFVIGALSIVVWAAVVWMAWAILDWCDDRTYQWASYLNSLAPARARARLFTYEHIQLWLTVLIWIVRWIVVPAKIVPHMVASVDWGWRLPWRRLFRVLLNWRWWVGVTVAALLGVLLPSYFFHGEPHGTVAHQMWAVGLKLTGTYLLAIASWVLVLAWGSVVLSRQVEPAADALDQQLLTRLQAGRWWIAGLAGWTLIFNAPLNGWVVAVVRLLLAIALLILSAGLIRALLGPGERRVPLILGIVMQFGWALPGLSLAVILKLYAGPGWLAPLCLVLAPGLLLPFGAVSAEVGPWLPWRKVLKVAANWRWWAGVVAAAIVGAGIPSVLLPSAPDQYGVFPNSAHFLRMVLADVLAMGSWVVLLGWFAVLFQREKRSADTPGDEALQLVPVASGPLGGDSVRLPLPESGDDVGGDI